jgi:hypothetical protein
MSKILFPRPFAIAVDDLGWNEGHDLSSDPIAGPYRCGVKRNFDLADYKHMTTVGEKVGARIQCLFILSEMDRANILAKFPTTTYQREKWNNSFRVNEEQRVIMNYVRDQSAHMEFGLHGTGHEYWAAGMQQKRAEWYNLIDKEPWPEQSIREHIQCFADIMAQYGFTKANGHSFPESFVPCAYSYYWNPGGEYSLGKLLSEVGVKYANTDFSQIPELNPPSEINGGGFDHGMHVINRVNYGNPWYELATLPRTPLAQQETDIIESHWPNWLAQDDFLQHEVTDKWIEYYKSVQRQPDRYVAKNTEQLHSQWLYRRYCKIDETRPGTVAIDNSFMPGEPYRSSMLGNMVLKLKLGAGQHVSKATLDGKLVPGYFEDEGFGFLYLPSLERKSYTLEYSLGAELLPTCILLDGTYNAYSLTLMQNGLTAEVKVYGTQTIRVRGKEVKIVFSEGKDLVVEQYSYDHSSGETRIRVRAKDMQGSRGRIVCES